jgi:Protein of unknown function (DUF2970)
MTEALHKRKTPLLLTVKAVLWGFLGVRRNSDYQDDIAKLNPLHLMAVGVDWFGQLGSRLARPPLSTFLI